MARKTASDFHPDVLKLFDKYVHGESSRRDFLLGAAKYAVAGVSAAGLLDALSPKFVEAQQVSPDDTSIKVSYKEFLSPKGTGTIRGYLAKPAKIKKKLPAILVVHENRGLNPHIEDITRRLAKDNFIAFAPDALYSLGGYPGDEDKARELFPKLDQSKIIEDFYTAAEELKHLKGTNGKVGVVGFCYGGSVANTLATRIADLGAAVPFYGRQPDEAEVAKIKCPLLIHYAELDERVNAGWPKYEAALKASNISYEAFIYPKAQHGFNNDTTPRYDEASAKLAWHRTVEFFNRYLRS